MSFYQLKRLLEARAKRHDLQLAVEITPWPYAGSLQRIGNCIFVWIDSRRSKTDQLAALAHEAGHLIFGHYQLDEQCWTLLDGPGGDGWEWEADLFAQFVTRTPGTPAEWFIGGQRILPLDPS